MWDEQQEDDSSISVESYKRLGAGVGERGDRCCDCDRSLAKTFGIVRSLFLTLWIAATHYIFYRGQFDVLYHNHVHLETKDVYVNISAVNLPVSGGPFNLNKTIPDQHLDDTISPFSLNFTLHQLATFQEVTDRSRREHGVTNDPAWDYNFESVEALYWLLLTMSMIWPHVKLGLVHILWYIPSNRKWRDTSLLILELAGKYTLMDLFLILQLVAYLNLDVSQPAAEIVNNTLTGLGGFDSRHLNNTLINKTICESNMTFPNCGAVLPYVLGNLDVAVKEFIRVHEVNGTVSGGMSVLTDPGIYYFSVAVWMTLLISIYANHYSSEFISACEAADHPRSSVQGDSTNSIKTTLLFSSGLSLPARLATMLLVIVAPTFVGLGLALPVMTRNVYGTVIEVLNFMLGRDDITGFQRNFSITTIMDELSTGDQNENYFLQKDLWAFIIVFPCLLVILGIAVLLIPMRPNAQWYLKEAVKFCYSFTGWEMFVVTIPFTTKSVVSLTKTLLLNQWGPLWKTCETAETWILDNPLGGTCLEVEPVINVPSFVVFIIGTVWLIVMRFVVVGIHTKHVNFMRTQESSKGGYQVITQASY